MDVSLSYWRKTDFFLLIINLYVIIYQRALAEQIDQYKACVSKQLDVIFNWLLYSIFCVKIEGGVGIFGFSVLAIF